MTRVNEHNSRTNLPNKIQQVTGLEISSLFHRQIQQQMVSIQHIKTGKQKERSCKIYIFIYNDSSVEKPKLKNS